MGRPTLNDVAARAGVSRSTASLVVRGSTRIPAATHARVQTAIAELGYVYDRAAANLRQRSTTTLALVMTDLHNPFFAELAMGLEEVTHRSGYTLLIGYSRDERTRQDELIEAMTQRRVDGMFLLPAHETSPDVLTSVESRGIPVVLFGRHLGTAAPYAGPDNREAGRLVGRHLGAVGARDVVFVGGPRTSSARVERLAGLREGAEGSFEVTAPPGATEETSRRAGVRAVEDLLAQGGWPDAIVAYNDLIAAGVCTGLRERGIAPGSEIAVASFDDVPGAAEQVPPLTTVATHPEEVGRASAELMLARLGGAVTEEQRLVRPTLRVRASTASWRPRGSPLTDLD